MSARSKGLKLFTKGKNTRRRRLRRKIKPRAELKKGLK